MAFEVVGPRKLRVAFGHPTRVRWMVVFLMDTFLVSLFVLLTFESLLFSGALVDAARITTRVLVLGDDQIAMHARLGCRGLGPRLGDAGRTSAFIISAFKSVMAGPTLLGIAESHGLFHITVRHYVNVML